MNWQTTIALAIVALAVTGLGWRAWRRRKFSFQRDTHCGCSAATSSGTTTSIVYHVRKGQRPRVIVKSK